MSHKKKPPRRALTIEQKCLHYDTLCERDQFYLYWKYNSPLELPDYVRARITNNSVIINWLFRVKDPEERRKLRQEFIDRIVDPVKACHWTYIFPEDKEIMFERILNLDPIRDRFFLCAPREWIWKQFDSFFVAEDFIDRVITRKAILDWFAVFTKEDWVIFKNRGPELFVH